MKKSILIFGGFGFLATYLIEELINHEYNLVVSDIDEGRLEYFKKTGIEFLKIDITNAEQFKILNKRKFDIVIHLATCQPANVSKSQYSAVNYINTNTIGTLNILDYCVKSRSERLIYTISHRNTQGLWKQGRMITENDERAIKYNGEYSMFSISESAAHDCVLHYQNQFGLNSVIFRLPPVYGYGPHTKIFKNGEPIKTGFELFIQSAKSGKPIELWGDVDVGRDIIYIRDVVEAFLKVMKFPNVKGLYNITSAYPLSIREQAKIIAKKFWVHGGNPIFIEKPELSNSIEPFVYDNSKALHDFGWEPKYDFKAMLDDYSLSEKSGKYDTLIRKRDTTHSEIDG